MKVLQTISGLSAKFGGPSTCTLDLLNGLYDINARVDLLTVTSSDILGKGSPWLREEPNDYVTPLGISKNIKHALLESDYDLYHANGLWSYSTHATCRHARKQGKPYVLSPHGMLYPTALAISSWKKRLMRKVWFDEDIMNATCIHATCKQEAEHIRAFGYKGPIAVIPNPVVIPEFANLAASKPLINGRKQIGFLGRLHPIKKVENVLYALDKVRGEKLEGLSFQIMGKDDERYEQWLKDEVRRLGLEECVEFVGFVSGKEKYERLSKLSALMVPSAQENFGMIVPEALICGTPVYASLGTPWEELNGERLEVRGERLEGRDEKGPSALLGVAKAPLRYRRRKPSSYSARRLEGRGERLEGNVGRCGWWKDNSPESIAEVLREVIDMSEQDLRAMGARGRKLIEQKYEQHMVAQMMLNLYKWINGDGDRPEFVV